LGIASLVCMVAILLLCAVITYNRLVRLRNHCSEAWSNVDTELRRRYDLIPNLVEVVKGYAAHEKGLFEEVTQRRQACMESAGSPGRRAETENTLVRAVLPLLARVEDYPELKADKSFLELQHELVNTEDRIQAARRFYNGNVRELNNRIQMFPSSIVARAMGFAQEDFFEIENLVERALPDVQLQP